MALRIVPWLWQLPPTDRLYYPLYTACVELGIPFCTQVGHTRTAAPLGNGPADPVHRPGRTRLAELTIVCGRIGYPWTTEMISVADEHQRPHRHQRLHRPPLPTELVDYSGRGRRKVFFGSKLHDHAKSGPGTPP